MLPDELSNIVVHRKRRNQPRDLPPESKPLSESHVHHRAVNDILHDTLEQLVLRHLSYKLIDIPTLFVTTIVLLTALTAQGF